ncbi:MAG TPA: hypothetical protein VFJ30_06630 [Phycisphaerae bacterium]|nr:hypothetical protein [Phycisphaerae bacterium]
MNGPARLLLAAAGAALAATAGGCIHTTAAFHADRQAVWRVAMGQAVVWRPDVIDERALEVRATKTGAKDSEFTYQLKVRTDLNPFARRPSTRVLVRIAQTNPRKRYWDEERLFLNRLAGNLQQTGAVGP